MQKKLIDKKLQDFIKLENEQALIDKYAAENTKTSPKKNPLAYALAHFKSVATLSGDMLAKIDCRMENFKHSLPFRIYHMMPKPIKAATESAFYDGVFNNSHQRFERALLEIATIPEGALLVEQAYKGNVLVMGFPGRVGKNRDLDGCISGQYVKNEKGEEVFEERIEVNTLRSHGDIVTALLHELQHYNQHQEKLLHPVGKIEVPLEAVWRNRMTEADAQASAIDMAYKLKEAGKPAAWNQSLRKKNPYSPMAKAYAKMGSQDPISLKDGRAKRACFDAWFTLKTPVFNIDISKLYNGQGIANLPDKARIMIAAEKDGATIFPLTTDELKKLGGLLPKSENYLALPGQRSLDSQFYRERNFSPDQMKSLKISYNNFAALKGAKLPKNEQKPKRQSDKPPQTKKPKAKAPGL